MNVTVSAPSVPQGVQGASPTQGKNKTTDTRNLLVAVC